MNDALYYPLVKYMHQSATFQYRDESARRQPLVFLFLESNENPVERGFAIRSERQDTLSVQDKCATVQLLGESGRDRVVHLLI